MRLDRNGQRRGAKPGEGHPLARLTRERVELLRRLVASGCSHSATAKAVGCSKSRVGAIVRGESWRAS